MPIRDLGSRKPDIALGMENNIINIFRCGNQELFHSAFLAWLLDTNGSHGFGDRFYRNLKQHFGEIADCSDYTNVSVEREFASSSARFDILLRSVTDSPQRKGIVLENKTKSFGTHAQLEKYKNQGFDVVGLALLPETFDSHSRKNFTVVTYATIVEILRRFKLDLSNGYHFIVDQYAQFVSQSLQAFELVRKLGDGKMDSEQFVPEFVASAKMLGFNQNDVRLFNYFYYFLLDEYLRENAPSLIFGTAEYNQKKSTKWLFYKNMQGPPYMECILEFPLAPNRRWKLCGALEKQFNDLRFQICPRIEIWLDPELLKRTSDVGRLLLGTWTRPVSDFLLNNAPFKSRFKRVGSRNFHGETITIADLKFETMANRIRAVLGHVLEQVSQNGGDEGG